MSETAPVQNRLTGGLLLLLGFVAGPCVTWLSWGVLPAELLILGPVISLGVLLLAWRLHAPRRLLQGWVIGGLLHLAVVTLVVLSFGSTLN